MRAPVASAFAVISAMPAAEPVVSAADPVPDGKARATRGGEPGLPASSPPPIRASDLLWLALALIVIVGTGARVIAPCDPSGSTDPPTPVPPVDTRAISVRLPETSRAKATTSLSPGAFVVT
jgi:hypothetical protein